MNYFITFFDKDLNGMADPIDLTKTYLPVSSFSITAKAVEFDDFTAVCSEANINNPVYVGLTDEKGNVIHLGFAGIPTVKQHKTYVTATDLRRIFNQTMPINEDSESFKTKYQLYDYLLGLPKTLDSELGMDYGVDLSYLSSVISDEDSVLPEGCLSDGVEFTSLWKLIVYFNTLFDLCLIADVDFSRDKSVGDKIITFRIVPNTSSVSFSLKEVSANVTYTTTDVNQTQAFYNGSPLILTDSDNNSKTARYVLLANNDVCLYDDLDTRYESGMYAGKTRRDYLMFPIVYKAFDTEYDESGESVTEDDINEQKAKSLQNALEGVTSQRYQEKVSFSVDSMFSTENISRIYTDDDGNFNFTKPFRYRAFIFGYNRGDEKTFKELPLSSITLSFNGKKLSKSVSFGYYSDYWFLKK